MPQQTDKIFDLEIKSHFAIWQFLKVNWILPQQTDKILDLESELKIEREWRQQLEAASHQEKETIYKMKEEMVYLLKVASVSTVMIWGPFHKILAPYTHPQLFEKLFAGAKVGRKGIGRKNSLWNRPLKTGLFSIPNQLKVASVSTVMVWEPDFLVSPTYLKMQA